MWELLLLVHFAAWSLQYLVIFTQPNLLKNNPKLNSLQDTIVYHHVMQKKDDKNCIDIIILNKQQKHIQIVMCKGTLSLIKDTMLKINEKSLSDVPVMQMQHPR